MKQFKSVFKFEYSGFVRSKSFIVVTIITVVMMAAGGSVPAIINLLKAAGIGEKAREVKKAAYYDAAGAYTDDVLTAYIPGREWIRIDSIDGVELRIEAGEFQSAVAIDGLRFTVYEKQNSISEVAAGAAAIEAMVRDVYQSQILTAAGLSQAEIAGVMAAAPVGEFVTVGKSYFENYTIAYIIVFFLYMSTTMYGSSILSSVVAEKSSKTMELLVTSAKPMSLRFGKVFGTGCAGLTQFCLEMLCGGGALALNRGGWTELSPVMSGVIGSVFSGGVLIYAVVFFLLGFFSLAFIYAALGSTVSRPEDAGGIGMLPQLLVIVTFFLSTAGLMTPNAAYVKICSFVPFLSPMVMFVRISMSDVPAVQIAAALAINIACILGTGWISTKIYRVGVMMYGKKPKLRDIVRYMRQA
jgi:ABC-2 type transport system permease protein